MSQKPEKPEPELPDWNSEVLRPRKLEDQDTGELVDLSQLPEELVEVGLEDLPSPQRPLQSGAQSGPESEPELPEAPPPTRGRPLLRPWLNTKGISLDRVRQQVVARIPDELRRKAQGRKYKTFRFQVWGGEEGACLAAKQFIDSLRPSGPNLTPPSELRLRALAALSSLQAGATKEEVLRVLRTLEELISELRGNLG